jgi:hypothetical protein
MMSSAIALALPNLAGDNGRGTLWFQREREWKVANDLPYSLFATRMRLFRPKSFIFGGFSGRFALTPGILRL